MLQLVQEYAISILSAFRITDNECKFIISDILLNYKYAEELLWKTDFQVSRKKE